MSSEILDKIIARDQNRAKNGFSAREVMTVLLSLLSEREARILRLRYGFNSQSPQTLESIGHKLNLTRERVRQIEKQAIANITHHQKYEEVITPFRHLVISLLEQHGGLMSKEKLFGKLVNLSQDQEPKESVLNFLLTNFMTGVDWVRERDFKPSLHLFGLSMDFVNQVLNELEKIFSQQDKILEPKEIIKIFQASEYYKLQSEKFSPWLSKNNNNLAQIIFSYLDTHRHFTKTPFNQWGLASWPVMTPKRVNGKIYFVMLAVKKPLHFTKITQIVNQSWPKARDIKTATVHNELIADERFVLVGRGIYALKDWGYEAGKAEQIIENILKNSKRPLSEKEIIEQVKKKKMVKDATIKLSLKNQKKFEKNGEGEYRLLE